MVSDRKKGLEVVRRLQEKGIKAHLVSRSFAFWPPADDDMSNLTRGMLWCPLCNEWRYFKVPRIVEGAEIGSHQWFLNSQARQEIKVCPWCHVSEYLFHVRLINQTWDRDQRKIRRRVRH